MQYIKNNLRRCIFVSNKWTSTRRTPVRASSTLSQPSLRKTNRTLSMDYPTLRRDYLTLSRDTLTLRRDNFTLSRGNLTLSRGNHTLSRGNLTLPPPMTTSRSPPLPQTPPLW